MWTYGDHVRTVAPRRELAAVAEALAAGGVDADLFTDAAAVAQALLDAEWRARGEVDAASPLGDGVLAALTGLARTLLRLAPSDPAPWRALAARAPARAVAARLAEGHAFYALHPAAYAASARRAGLGPRDRVVGLRSIGVGLAAVVAAAAGARPPVTVRPTGDPFRRRVCVDPALFAGWAEGGETVALVDEGPGLSGSSFTAAAEALEAAGVARERLVLLPGHGGDPGAKAPPAARELWREARRAPADAAPPPAWEAHAGPLAAPPRDVSGGAWRADFPGRTDLPADPGRERRKLVAEGARGRWLARWAGLGAEARGKAERAAALARAGLGPPAPVLQEGWLLRPWVDGRPLRPDDPTPLAELAALLRLRSGWSAGEPGADAATLAEMARVNAGEALGSAAGDRTAARVVAGLTGAAPLAAWTDSRLHRHEWIRTTDGRVLKTDGEDHARAHDLVGRQEIGWDVAGAAVEWDLAPADTARLADAAGAPRARLPALELAYLAFQLGLWTEAAARDPALATAALADGYARRLTRRLGEG